MDLVVLCKYIDEIFFKNFIQHSKSLAEAPILFVKKKDGSLHMYVDCHELNKVIQMNFYPLSLFSGLLEQFESAKIFTKIDWKGTYNLV